MLTEYAPAERDSTEKLMDEHNLLKSIIYVEQLINALPYYGAIINDKRQIIFANEKLLSSFSLSSIENIVGLRTGEALNCINAFKSEGGCGTSKNCSVCGAVNCILEAQRKNERVVRECRITAIQEGETHAYEFKVMTTPFEWMEQKYYVFSMVDISDEKRRKALEKIFFHDVINKTGSMNGFIELIKIEKDPERHKYLLDLLELINRDLIEEIQSQRDLLSAENSELKVKSQEVKTESLIEFIVNQMSQHEVSKAKNIIIESASQSAFVKTDLILLKRILINMVKNALEASKAGDTVWIGCQSYIEYIRFWVKNSSVMQEAVKQQVFQRSFSTKGVNRGLGTYSMKLLGEKYLNGKVDFISTESEGTIFFIDLPR